MQDILRLFSSLFKHFIEVMDEFEIVAGLSLLDFIIIIAVLDIVITALFVTFNIRVSSDDSSVSFTSGSDGRSH